MTGDRGFREYLAQNPPDGGFWLFDEETVLSAVRISGSGNKTVIRPKIDGCGPSFTEERA